jgi:hypothetical protein
VRNQCLVWVQFQLEIVPQELSQALLDLLGFGLRSGEPEEGVVGVSTVAEPPVVWILRMAESGSGSMRFDEFGE